jgi:hypothetical protein
VSDTYTGSALLTKMEPGSHQTSWGDIINLMLDLIEEMAWSMASIPITASPHVLPAITANTSSVARKAAWKFTGSIAADQSVTVPAALARVVVVLNSTNKALTFGYGSGATVQVASGQRALLLLTGSDVLIASTTAQTALYFQGHPPSDFAQIAVANAFTAGLALASLAPGAAASFTPDASAANVFDLAFTGGTGTLNNPTNLVDGLELWFAVHGSSMTTLNLGNKFKFAGGATPPYSGAGHTDIIHGIYNAASDKIYCEYLANIS